VGDAAAAADVNVNQLLKKKKVPGTKRGQVENRVKSVPLGSMPFLAVCGVVAEAPLMLISAGASPPPPTHC
jgi:hypothetical protein